MPRGRDESQLPNGTGEQSQRMKTSTLSCCPVTSSLWVNRLMFALSNVHQYVTIPCFLICVAFIHLSISHLAVTYMGTCMLMSVASTTSLSYSDLSVETGPAVETRIFRFGSAVQYQTNERACWSLIRPHTWSLGEKLTNMSTWFHL